MKQQKSRIVNCTFKYQIMSHLYSSQLGHQFNVMLINLPKPHHNIHYTHIHKTFYHIKNYNTFFPNLPKSFTFIHKKKKKIPFNTLFRHAINTQFQRNCKQRKITHLNVEQLVGLDIIVFIFKQCSAVFNHKRYNQKLILCI